MLSNKLASRFIIWACLGLWAFGCGFANKQLHIRYDAEGKPIMAKRHRKLVIRDFITKINTIAYKKNNTSGPHFLLSPIQKEIKEKYGPPSYISPSWLSLEGDYVIEWLYWEKGVMFQFVNRQMAFEGPLTDKERVLVVFGYPDDARVYLLGEIGIRENFYYHTILGTTQRTFNFMNGKMVGNTSFQ